MYENLFTILPDESTVETILRLFGIETMSHGEMFHKELINEDTLLQEFVKLKILLSTKYRPYKLKQMYTSLTLSKCITILKHFLGAVGFYLQSAEGTYLLVDIHKVKKKREVVVTFD